MNLVAFRAILGLSRPVRRKAAGGQSAPVRGGQVGATALQSINIGGTHNGLWFIPAIQIRHIGWQVDRFDAEIVARVVGPLSISLTLAVIERRRTTATARSGSARAFSSFDCEQARKRKCRVTLKSPTSYVT